MISLQQMLQLQELSVDLPVMHCAPRFMFELTCSPFPAVIFKLELFDLPAGCFLCLLLFFPLHMHNYVPFPETKILFPWLQKSYPHIGVDFFDPSAILKRTGWVLYSLLQGMLPWKVQLLSQSALLQWH